MSVLLVTSLGDIVIDLHTDRCPIATKNFLKLCKIKYYNHCLFHSVQKDFIAQTGDPTGKGSGGDSIYKFLYGEQARFFTDEIHQDLKHSKVGTVAMASAGENLNTSQFYITLREELDYLDGKHTVFGEVAEGFETLTRINESFVDDNGRPYKNIRIKHSYILDDPFDDPPQLVELIPELSPEQRPPEQGEEIRLEDDWVPMDEQINPEELEKSLRKKEAQSRAVVLEMIGDIPEAEITPPENVLFVCKLNPVTQEEDLEVIFSRFGKVISADIIRDYKTGDSLCYAFIEFETQEACEAAYLKMDNVLIDDRRIHVDFSQSVAKLWNQYRRAGRKMGDAVQGRQNGCYKCGEVGHIARECSNDADQEKITASQQHPKYVLKDSNKQLGGSGKSYDMIFEVDCLEDDERKHRRHTSGHHGKDQVYVRSQRQEKYDKLSKEQRSSMDRERKSSEMDNNNDSKRRHSSEISERGRYRYNDHRETHRSSEVDHEFRDRREQNYMKTYEQVTHERKRRLGNVEQQSKTNDRHSKRRDHDERERSRHERDHKKGRLEKEREDDRYGYRKSQCKESSSRRS